MAIKPRIHWAWDGAKFYPWDYDGGTIGAEGTQADREKMDGDQFVSSNYDPPKGLCLQFADPVQIHSIKFRSVIASYTALRMWVSSEVAPTDYSPVGDPQWTQIMFDASYTQPDYSEIAVSPIINCKWLLFRDNNGTLNQIQCFHIFGEYIAPKFEFWNTGETAELNTLQIPLPLPNAPNSVDYHQYLNFKLKNTDSSTHSYSLTVSAVKYGGDTLITNNFKLAKYSDGYIKSGTITLSNIAAGEFSENLRIYADILIGVNPADGMHYFVIDVTETA